MPLLMYCSGAAMSPTNKRFFCVKKIFIDPDDSENVDSRLKREILRNVATFEKIWTPPLL
jgi:hypothetical protein